jgi:hypothetical protein
MHHNIYINTYTFLRKIKQTDFQKNKIKQTEYMHIISVAPGIQFLPLTMTTQ